MRSVNDVRCIAGERVPPYGLNGVAGFGVHHVGGGRCWVWTAVASDVLCGNILDRSVITGITDGVADGVCGSCGNNVGEDCVGGGYCS